MQTDSLQLERSLTKAAPANNAPICIAGSPSRCFQEELLERTVQQARRSNMQLASSRASCSSMRHSVHIGKRNCTVVPITRLKASMALDGAVPNDKPEEVGRQHQPP
jgi:hypothetical protein